MWYMLIAFIVCVIYDRAGKPRREHRIDLYANVKEIMLCIWKLTVGMLVFAAYWYLMDVFVFGAKFHPAATLPFVFGYLRIVLGAFFIFVAFHSFLWLIAYVIELLFSLPEPYRHDQEDE